MLDRDSIEQAYCFFHQKWRVYSGMASDWQRDDIEYALSSYVDAMNQELYERISEGDNAFLREHSRFCDDMLKALEILEDMISGMN